MPLAAATFEPLVVQPLYVEQTVRALAGAVLGRTRGDARTLLHEALNIVQPDPYSWTPGAAEPDLQFDRRGGLKESVLRRIMVVDALPRQWEVDLPLREDYRRSLRAALERLAVAAPELHRSVTMVTAAILFARLEGFGGGSNSGAVGCVWLNPGAHWTEADWIENLVHEYLHQCLFLADMRYGLFEVDGEALAREEALVTSALLRTLRPYDRAYHSCFVSFALMQLNCRLGTPERALEHLEPLQTTIAGLIAKPAYLTPYGFAALESLRDASRAFTLC